MILLDRIYWIRNQLPSDIAWNIMDESARGRRMSDLFKTDNLYNGFTVNIIFSKCYRMVKDKYGLRFGWDFSYPILLEIFDLMARYAKLWIFS